MTVGVVMLVHTAFDRAKQVAQLWNDAGCPVVMHVDRKVDKDTFQEFKRQFSDRPDIIFCRRHRCDWGTFSLVKATQSASELMLRSFDQVRHVYLASGSCLPLRPVKELIEHLDRNRRTDYIESVTTQDVMWTTNGLDSERFTLRFPFAWKKQRRLFDGYVRLQRRFGRKRRVPDGLVPHLGSQWWCLTRRTLSAILEDPDRGIYDRFFSRVWIPDESYFQTLVRQYSTEIESRSLTLSKFDYQGKPHIFYDDHLELLRSSDCFVARKIWPHADRLYSTFLSAQDGQSKMAKPNPGKIDRIFAKAVERRTKGRPGLYMHSRYPRDGFENGKTAAQYSVFEGFSDLFEDFEHWLAKSVQGRVHGHLFGPDKVEFSGQTNIYAGCLSDSASLRDYNAKSFLTNLIWNTRGERQCFQFGPRDNQDASWTIATDSNAQISVISGAWAVPLFQSNRNFSELRNEAAKLQKIENQHLEILRSVFTKARVRIWTMSEFVESPMEPLQTIIEEIGLSHRPRLTEAPKLVDLTGFGQFLQNLKNQGMKPYLMGEFPVESDMDNQNERPSRPYLVR